MERILNSIQTKVYAQIYREGICESDERVDGIIKIASKHKRGILVIVNKIGHGNLILERLKLEGHNVKFVHGSHNDDIRDRFKEEFANGSLNILIASMIYKEGIDLPHLKVLVIACGENAPHTILQVFGRGLRRSKGKCKVQVYDFVDTCHKVLDKHTCARMEIYKREGFKPRKKYLSNL